MVFILRYSLITLLAGLLAPSLGQAEQPGEPAGVLPAEIATAVSALSMVSPRSLTLEPEAALLDPPPPPITAGQQFGSLSDAVLFYLALSRDPLWQPLPRGPQLQRGDSHPQVVLLRTLLQLYGDLPDRPESSTGQPSWLFDERLEQGLMAFQRRFGLTADGLLGPLTRATLNVSPQERALQIAINLDRQQAFRDRAASRFIQVNIPAYQLRMVDQGTEVLRMKAIIGRQSRPTPLLESEIQTLVFNPSWSVPKSIAYKDILPQWRADQDYLNKHNLKVLAGWQQPEEVIGSSPDDARFYRGPNYLRFWQPPGEDNALGRVKFMFQNDFTVYLHDTPQQQLFSATERAFSSGCIRLEKPLQLAQQLLTLSFDNAAQRLEYMLASRQTRHVRLQQSVALYITYWTAWLDQQGQLNFSPDIYRHDALAMAALQR